MTNPAKNKGDRAEREIAAILSDQLGIDIRRKLGAGRQDDEGDLHGLPECTVEVKNYRDIAAAVRDGLDDLQREQRNACTPFGAAFIRRPGGRWFVAMSVEQFVTIYREAMA
jgi:Holliday junction resolvase